jgi:WD40-like Beta Propeller Repeat
VLSKKGLSLYFARRPQTAVALGGDDIWVSQRESVDDEWGAPVKLGRTINSAFREFSPSLSRDEHWMFFSSDRPSGVGGAPFGDIWAFVASERPRRFRLADADQPRPERQHDVERLRGSYFANEGGNPKLYFASDRPGGAGQPDLYMSELQADGSWGPATRIPELSSAELEAGPSIRDDGLEIFFFRPLHPSDVWVATRDSVDAPWSTPVNFGPPVNTSVNDFVHDLAAHGRTLFISSNRPGGYGQYDLYMSTRSKSRGH